MKTIAIFQYEWAIQCHTINLANALADKGYQVHLFLYNCSSIYVDAEGLKTSKGVKVHVRELDKSNRIKRLIDRLFVNIFRRFIFRDIISKNAIRYSSKTLENDSKIVFLGVEKKGLAWAGYTKRNLTGVLIYYSLELYRFNPGWFNKTDFKESRRLEKKFHKLSEYTIIQDSLRSAALQEYNGFPKSKIILLPVSVLRRAVSDIEKKSSEEFIVFYFGLVESRRHVEEFILAFNKFSFRAVLRVHGPSYNRTFSDYLKLKYASEKVIITTTLTSEDEIDQLFKKSKIGLCVYSNDNLNERLTAFSSEKIARYFEYGIPVVSNHNESYSMLFSEFECGVMIRSFDEMEDAIINIKDNYEYYSKNAVKAFEKYFNFESAKMSLMDILEKI